jgi:hypothetical protein
VSFRIENIVNLFFFVGHHLFLGCPTPQTGVVVAKESELAYRLKARPLDPTSFQGRKQWVDFRVIRNRCCDRKVVGKGIAVEDVSFLRGLTRKAEWR